MGFRPGSARPEPPSLPDVFRSGDFPPWVVAERVRTQTWVRLRQGAFLPAPADPARLELGRVVAVHHRLRVPHWFSHTSAAMLWGLPLHRAPTVTHLRQLTRPAASRDRSLVRHAGPVEERATVAGLPVTGLALTAADCLRTLPPLDGLVVADGALRAQADPARIGALLERGAPGSATARAVAALADAGAESVAETATRFHLLAAGLPIPQTQVRVTTDRGVYWADLGYPQWRLIIEYDGTDKYTDADAFFRERDRQSAIEAQGWRVVRLTYKDLRDPTRLVRRVLACLPSDTVLTRRPYLR